MDTTTAGTHTEARPELAVSASAPVLDLVIPVYDEAAGLERAVRTTRAYLDSQLPYSSRLTIADNASTDGTLEIAQRLAAELTGVRVVHLDARGRGRALHTAWLASDAQVFAYMDVDLSTDLSALLPLIAPLVSGHSHLAIGTRLSRTARVVRGPAREVISRSYNLLLRGTLAARFSDAQCGFKAIRSDAAHALLPLVADTGWFFDTELLVLAERAGLRIHEVPVDWVDDPDSRVDIVATALADLHGIARVGRDLAAGRLPLAELRGHLPLVGDAPPPGPDDASHGTGDARTTLLHQLVRFAVVGVASTIAYGILYLLLRGPLGAQSANVTALLLTAIANTAANRRVTFGISGRDRAATHQGQGLIVFGLAWALTSGSLALLGVVAPTAGHLTELAVLAVANLAATVLRFVLLRHWVFRPRRAADSSIDRAEGTVR
ncbi:MAG TPA: bifunctional glycosyltransferase family 2/GtrA family protein [Cellulomonas sp.]|uniref:bifunctional glycosyltransferase family 2/GtrA family protein n=1 Tax=Cellulomonas sp. TaxID=40001 RepID=UPI002E32BCC0|nr:bifunctional glycosyltransferase family 2/GtrA family protein [Cellulomonas sp.]HEX5332584.1 bifunctional glycosyltransferase family 2/GtrA family protein [Cellulomonas sp.]